MISLRILGQPQRVFYRDARVLADLAGLGSPHELLDSVGILVSGIEGETPNLSVTLVNSSRQCTDLFRFPPLGAAAEIRDGAVVRFGATVKRVQIAGDVCTVTIETALAQPLPLRLSTIWSGFRDAVPLPHRYGTTSGELIQYNEARTQFCWADHPCMSVDEVLIEDQAAGGWQFRTIVDSSIHAITIVEFDQAAPEGVRLFARGRGKLHPVTGALMTNPATVIWDVLANIAGWSASESQLDAFRRECEILGLEVGGSIEAAEKAHDVARAICSSIGAAFCADAPELCRIIEGGASAAPRLVIRDGVATAVSDDDALCNDLTVQFGFEDGRPNGSVQLEAPDYVKRDGRRAETLAAEWISSARVAYAVASRLLIDRARPRWIVTLDGVSKPLQVFDPVQLAHAGVPVLGTFRVRSREVDIGARSMSVTLTAPQGDVPALRLVRESVAYAAQQYVGATQQAIGTDRVWTITEADGRPIVGASVTANGFTRATDSAGRVAFPASALPPGSYVFQVATLDGRTWPYPTVIV